MTLSLGKYRGGRLKKLSGLYGILLGESVSAFVRPKHDEIEKLYSGYMDFDRINEFTGQMMKEVI